MEVSSPLKETILKKEILLNFKLKEISFIQPFVRLFPFLFCWCIYFPQAASQNADINLLKQINPQHPTSNVWKAATSSVYPIAVTMPATLLLVGFIEHNENLKNKGWEAVGGLIINTAATQGLKYIVNRDRPYEKYPDKVFPHEIENSPSFPSGHTSTAFEIATVLTIQFKKWYIVVPAYAWAAGVGYSRLYLGEHYPTDVFAGAALGAGSAWLTHWLNKKFFLNHEHNRSHSPGNR